MRAPATGRRLAALLLVWPGGRRDPLEERSLLPFASYVALALVALIAMAAGFALRRVRVLGTGSAVAGALLAGLP